MQLKSLLGPEVTARSAGGAIEIAGITADSRQVRPGWLFAAMPGSKADGAHFVPDAIAKGAAAILVKEGTQVATPAGIAVLTAAEPRQALARMAARFYPGQPGTIVAVTGTSGKTSVADFARQIFAHLGRKAASLGTIGLVKPDGSVYAELLPPDGTAVVNADAEHASQVIAAARERGRAILTVGRDGEALKLASLSRDGFAQRLLIRHDGESYDIRLPLLGDYQAANALLAAGLAIAAGELAARVLPALAELEGVKGRLEIVGNVRGALIVIDYAHKPDALEAALTALRPFAPGRLVCVFGCGGDRDKGKRPIMGRIAARLANHVIVTDDNPRSERPEAIRAEILAGAPGSREIGDRAEAIRAGARLLGHGDLLLIAGKGHETGQIVGPTVLPFSDHEAVRAALSETPING